MYEDLFLLGGFGIVKRGHNNCIIFSIYLCNITTSVCGGKVSVSMILVWWCTFYLHGATMSLVHLDKRMVSMKRGGKAHIFIYTFQELRPKTEGRHLDSVIFCESNRISWLQLTTKR